MPRPCSLALAMLLVAAFGLPAAAQQRHVLRQIELGQLDQAGGLLGGTLDRGTGTLRIDNLTNRGRKIAILSLDNPGITQPVYALEGLVRYEKVTGPSYLEMYSETADGRRKFSRSLSETGPLAALTGDSGWRRFALPYTFGPGDSTRPVRLDLNLMLAGFGRVELTDLQLVEYPAGSDPLADPGLWWTSRDLGLVGTVLGVLGGLLGTVIGVLAGLRQVRGARLASLVTLAVGACLVAACLLAVVQSQPLDVIFPLLLGGSVLALVGGLLYRRMSAAGHSRL